MNIYDWNPTQELRWRQDMLGGHPYSRTLQQKWQRFQLNKEREEEWRQLPVVEFYPDPPDRM